MSSRRSVDAVVVTWNCRSVIRDCLDSLSKSQNVTVATWVVDNDSSDGTLEAIMLRPAVDSLVPLDENEGFARASNRGAALGCSPYVLMINPDTVVQPDTISLCIERLEECPDIGLVGPLIRLPDGSVQRECARYLPSLWRILCEALYLHVLFPRSRAFCGIRSDEHLRAHSGEVECVLGAFMLLRRSDWEDLGGFDESVFMYLEDVDLCARVRESDLRVWFEHSAEMIHIAGHSSRQSDRNLDLLYGEVRYRYFMDHGGRHAALTALWLVAVGAVFRAIVAPLVALRAGRGWFAAVRSQWNTSRGLLRWARRTVVSHRMSAPVGSMGSPK